MTQARITLTAEASPLNSVTQELLAELAQRPREVVDAVLRALQAIAQPARIEQRDFPAPGASEVALVFHASDAFLGLLSAVRARDFDV